MKLSSYHYEKGKVKLDFAFQIGENEYQEKADFIELLKEALDELNNELEEKLNNSIEQIKEKEL